MGEKFPREWLQDSADPDPRLALLFLPALLWWKESVPFLVFVSVYANFVGHWAAWEAAQAKEEAEAKAKEAEASKDEAEEAKDEAEASLRD